MQSANSTVSPTQHCGHGTNPTQHHAESGAQQRQPVASSPPAVRAMPQRTQTVTDTAQRLLRFLLLFSLLFFLLFLCLLPLLPSRRLSLLFLLFRRLRLLLLSLPLSLPLLLELLVSRASRLPFAAARPDPEASPWVASTPRRNAVFGLARSLPSECP